MSGKGGKTSTSWSGSSWVNAETKAVRIPIALADEIMAYARARDRGDIVSYCHVRGNTASETLKAIAQYTEIRRRDRHNNQHNKDGELNLNARTWDELRRFAKLVKENPRLLGLNE